MRTTFVKPLTCERKWYIIDAEGQVLGRVAAKAAYYLRGKHKPFYTPHQEIGDYIIIINAAKAKVTGRKLTSKLYYHHSGYPSGMKVQSYRELLQKKPTAPMEKAVRGMLPKGTLGNQLFRNTKVYAGADFPHQAQKPEPLAL